MADDQPRIERHESNHAKPQIHLRQIKVRDEQHTDHERSNNTRDHACPNLLHEQMMALGVDLRGESKSIQLLLYHVFVGGWVLSKTPELNKASGD